MKILIRERLRPFALPRGRCLDKSAEATEHDLGFPDNVDLTRQELPQLCKVRYPEPWISLMPTAL